MPQFHSTGALTVKPRSERQHYGEPRAKWTEVVGADLVKVAAQLLNSSLNLCGSSPAQDLAVVPGKPDSRGSGSLPELKG